MLKKSIFFVIAMASADSSLMLAMEDSKQERVIDQKATEALRLLFEKSALNDMYNISSDDVALLEPVFMIFEN